MANSLAPATVTAALQRLLQAAARDGVPGARAVVERPDATKTGPVVGIFLYEVVPNAALGNQMLPSRGPDGTLRARSITAVDLRYLLTFHGDETELEPLRLLGSVLRALAAQPVITRPLVDAVVAAGSAVPPTYPWAAGSDLAADPELPRLSPHTLDLEQMSHLWSLFPQAAYALSCVWQVGPVVVESTATPQPAAPVVTTSLSVSPLTSPVVTRVEPADPAAGVLTAGTVWRVVGEHLTGPSTQVRVAGTDVPVEAGSDAELRVDASPASALRAGRVLLEVLHRAVLGDPAGPRAAIARAQHLVDVSARVASVEHTAGRVTVTTDVPVRTRQRATLSLLDPGTGAVVLRSAPTVPQQDATSLDVPVEGVAAGTYGAVLTVDGVDSVLRRDAAGTITDPLVEVP